MAIRPVRFASDALLLEGRLAEPDGPARAGVVLCHPHPLYQGSMSSALIPALQRAFAAAGFLALRFNFRGVGKSEGAFDEGRGEVDDARAALELMVSELPPATPLVSAGWSFGSVVALHAALRMPRVAAAVAIAPPLGGDSRSPDPPDPAAVRAWGRPVLVVGGERDTLAPVASMPAWVERAGAELVVLDADHFFRPPDQVIETVLAFLRAHDVG